MIRDLTLLDACIVCSDMRAEDVACVRAATGREPGEWFAVDRWQSNGPAWTWLQDGMPWAIGGLTLVNDWAGVAWFVARPGLRRSSWIAVVRAMHRVLRASTATDNPQRRRRIEAHVLHGWVGASALARHMGLQFEGLRLGAGARGESFEMWGLVAPEGRKTPELERDTATGVIA